MLKFGQCTATVVSFMLFFILKTKAWCEGQGRVKRRHAAGPADKELIIPGWSTFFRAWTDGWQKLLKFRKKSQHSECTICAESRLKLHDKNLSSEERTSEAAKWRRHRVDQYHDRLLYWSLRYASRNMI